MGRSSRDLDVWSAPPRDFRTTRRLMGAKGDNDVAHGRGVQHADKNNDEMQLRNAKCKM